MSAKPTFVFGVDLDGVVADYETGIRRAVASYTGIDEGLYGPMTSWKISECAWPGVRDNQHYLEMHARAVEEHLLRDLPLIDGASEGLWALSEAGVWIRIVTHRLVVNFGHARAVTDTVEWLDQDITLPDGTVRKAIPYRDICFIGEKVKVGCDIYVDDAPHNVAALRDGGAYTVCFGQAYNSGVPGPRVSSWPELVDVVLARRDELGLADAA